MSPASLRSTLESHQIAIYFAAVITAALLAWQWPAAAAVEPAIEPLLGFMLFVTFLQVPLTALRRAWSNLRFLVALLVANFVGVPLLVALLLPLFPDEPLLRIGMLLVLLTPCIDYVITFSHLGKADARQLLASTPVLLAAQMLLLPIYLGMFIGDQAKQLVNWAPFLRAFLWLIVVPVSLAAVCQQWAQRSARGQRLTNLLDLMPVPATAAVLFVVVASVIPPLSMALEAVWQAACVYVLFAVAAPILGWAVSRLVRLPPAQGRAVAFSTATRNSLVVLPLGLAIPGALPLVPAVIVTQTLVELVFELIYVRLIARGRER